ncbi:MAG TPA: hypothetical protein DDY71_06555 [Spirochaetia bacterium]|nr:hypothetical protein [Spirochaetia bacterium]HBI37290.1 hypothetical protein [Spirochaetia bacterium]
MKILKKTVVFIFALLFLMSCTNPDQTTAVVVVPDVQKSDVKVLIDVPDNMKIQQYKVDIKSLSNEYYSKQEVESILSFSLPYDTYDFTASIIDENDIIVGSKTITKVIDKATSLVLINFTITNTPATSMLITLPSDLNTIVKEISIQGNFNSNTMIDEKITNFNVNTNIVLKSPLSGTCQLSILFKDINGEIYYQYSQNIELVNGKVNPIILTELTEKKVLPVVFSIDSEIVETNTKLYLSTKTDDTSVFYTINDTTPDNTSLEYTGPITLTESVTIQAIAYKSNMASSFISSKKYIVDDYITPTPSIITSEGVYSNKLSVLINTIESDSKIYYSINSQDPTELSEIYTKEIILDTEGEYEIKAIAITPGKSPSSVVSKKFTIENIAITTVEVPLVTPESGMYEKEIQVTLIPVTANSVIYYTLDNSTPTKFSTKYIEPFMLTEEKTYTLKVIAYIDVIYSSIVEKSFTIDKSIVTVLPPEISPSIGTYDKDITVTITPVTENSVIYYTLDNSIPTKLSTKYTEPFILTEEKKYTLKVIASIDDIFSSMVEKSYIIDKSIIPVKAPLVSLESGTYDKDITVTITPVTENSVIYYTLDNSAPTKLSTKYIAPFTLTEEKTYTLKTIAYNGSIFSDVVEKSYIIDKPTQIIQPPLVTPESNTYENDILVSLTPLTNGSVIYYTLDNSTPTKLSTKYTVPFTLTEEKTYILKAIAYVDDLFSIITEKTYTIIKQEIQDKIILNAKNFNWVYIWNTTDTSLNTKRHQMTATSNGWSTMSFTVNTMKMIFTPADSWDGKTIDLEAPAVGEYWYTAETGLTTTNPEGPVKPSIIITPSGGKYKGEVEITITINDNGYPVSSKTASFNSTNITLNTTVTSVLLKDFLSDKTTGSLVVSATNEAGTTDLSYTYERDDTIIITNTDDIDNLRIFQVMVCSFQDGDSSKGYDWQWNSPSMAGGDLQGVINSLDYIKDLGMNALWMTPIFETYSGQQAHNGYFANNYFNVDPKFGTNELFAELVTKAHEKGIYVILDGVLGHNDGSNIAASPLSGKKPSTSNPVNYSDGGDSLQFYKDVVYYWIKNYKIDGWRFDQSYQLGPGNAGHAGQGAGKFFWDDIRIEIEKAVNENKNDSSNPTVGGKKWGTLGYMVGEDWEDQEGIKTNTYGTTEEGVHSAFDFPLRYTLVQSLAKEEWGKEVTTGRAENIKTGYDTHSVYPDWAHPNLMIGNHDLARFGDLINFSTAHNNNYGLRHKAAYSILASYSGPVTLYYGEEWGQKTGNSDLKSMHVSRTNGKISGFSAEEQDLVNFYKKLMQIRAENSSLWQEGTRTNLIASGDKYADLKYDAETGNKTVYCLNLGTGNITIELNQSDIGGTSMLEAISNTTINPASGKYTINLSALEPKIFIVQ